MTSNGLSFHHPYAFWLGCAAIAGGVLAHLPMFFGSADMHYQLAGMPMTRAMVLGMLAIPLGLALAAHGLMPRLGAMRRQAQSGLQLRFHIADGAGLNSQHWKLVAVLLVALVVDVMKPATLGFVMPGVIREYAIDKSVAGLLALVALTGTTIGSVVWGRLADLCGRRAAILLSALMFIGTAICGAMPSFGWNLVMCFLMGASAGGLLPIAFTLMAEMIPAANRGWLLVALGGLGTSVGYLAAAGSASLLEPLFSWRALWLLGLPTGALIIFLDRYIPESPRFLASAGLDDQARAVLAKFSGVVDSTAAVPPVGATAARSAAQAERVGATHLLRGEHAPITWALSACGLGWGLANFGFLLWLPVNLGAMGMGAGAASALLARSALLALPGMLIVIWLYHRWSSIRTLVLFTLLSACSLLAFFVLAALHAHATLALVLATACLLVSASGVIATLIPYAAEIYPVRLRATGTGLIAASSKFGGILGAGLGVLGLFGNLALSALLIALLMVASALMLMRSGIDTRGRGLEEIQQAFDSRQNAV